MRKTKNISVEKSRTVSQRIGIVDLDSTTNTNPPSRRILQSAEESVVPRHHVLRRGHGQRNGCHGELYPFSFVFYHVLSSIQVINGANLFCTPCFPALLPRVR